MFQTKLFRFDTPLSTEEIYLAMQGDQKWYTRSMIAKALGCSKSPTLIKAINQAVEQGMLYWTTEAMPNGVSCYYYWLVEWGLQPDAVSASDGSVVFMPF